MLCSKLRQINLNTSISNTKKDKRTGSRLDPPFIKMKLSLVCTLNFKKNTVSPNDFRCLQQNDKMNYEPLKI